MVTTIVSELGKVRPVCFARSQLLMAANSLEAGNIIKADRQLWVAVCRYLESMCEAHNCTPKRKRLRTPAVMARALFKAGGIDRAIYDWLRELIDYAGWCASGRIVRVSIIETSISWMHVMLDSSPEINLPERQGGAV